MKHSTLFSWGNEVCRKGIYNNVSTTVKTFVLAVFMILWGSITVNAQSASLSVSGSNLFDLPLGSQAQPTNNHHHEGCSNCGSISSNNWVEESSTACDFGFDNWTPILSGVTSSCDKSAWTGGYCSGVPNTTSVTKTVNFPTNAAFLDFEVFSLSADLLNDGLDYSQIKLNGDVVYTRMHTVANNTIGYINQSVNVSAYAGQSVTIELSNVVSEDNLQGNVFFACFEFNCSDCVPTIEMTCAADASVECGQEGNLDLTGMPSIEVSACDDNTTLEVSHSDEIIPGNNCSYTIIRTWVATFGNISESCTQTISVSDSQSPEISGVEPVVTVQCLEDVPAPAEASAFDACSGSTPVVNFVSNTGEVISHCDISTAFGPGPDWALWLPTLFQNGYSASANWHFVGNGSFDQYADGTARIYGTIENSLNSNQQFLVEFWFENASDWTTWSSMGRSYKDDLGCAQPDHFMDWTYYEMVNNFSIMTGLGDFAGDVLYFQHQPTNYFFGMQIGQGANNKNCNYGLSTWFYYNGFVNGEYVTGLGDLNGDASCEPVNEQDCVHNTEFTYLYRAADACGHNTIVSQQIIVNDTTAPEFVDCPEAVTVECSDELPAVATPSAVDNCVGDVTVTYLGETAEGNECLTLVTRTWSAEDVCGNRSYCQQVISVVDTTAPTFDATPAEEVTYECSAVEEPAVLTATDNCAEVSVVSYDEEIEAGNCTGNYTIIRHWTAVDNCENFAHFYQTVHVVDTTAPVFDEYPYYTSILCENLPSIITAQDNCGTVEVVVTLEELNSGGCLGVLHRIYTATDDCGNSSTAEQYITIVDFTAPTIYGVGEETTVECSDVPGGDYLFGMGDVYAIDNCGGDVTLTYGEEVVATDDNCPQSYDVIRTWTAIDYCENVTVVTQLVHVVDTTAPVFVEYVAEVSISCDQEIPAPFATAEDNCGEVTITSNDEIVAGNCPQAYTIVRTYVAMDECGNASTLVTYINIYDEEAPIFDANATAQLTVECSDEIPYMEPAATDNCGEVSISYVDNTLESSACYTTIARVFTAVDECGNSSEFTQYINIVDTTAPVFDAYALEIDRPCDDFEGTYITATDNCNNFEITFVDEHVSGSCAGRIIRQYAASDICGNVAYATQIITLIDEVAPVASYTPESFTVECGSEYLMPAAQFEDNCDSELEVSEVTSTEFDGCTTIITYTWTAEDHCFNTTSVSASVTIVDTTSPEWEYVPADITIECSDEVPAAEMAYAWDICDENVDVEMTQDTIAGNCANNYTIRRIYRAFDDCGNEAMAIQNINVQDTTAPSVEGQSEVIVECGNEIPEIFPSATDNCGEVETTYVDYATISPWFAISNGGDGVVDLSELPSNISVIGSNSLSFSEIFTAAAVVAKQVNISFDWTFEAGDSGVGSEDPAFYDPFGYWINGEFTAISNVYGADNQSGSYSIIVPAGSIFALGINSVDDIEGPGIVEISNLSVEASALECPIVDCILRQFTSVDECGNSTVFNQFIVTRDIIAPVFNAYEAEINLPCDNYEGVFVSASDECSEVEISYTDEHVSGGCQGRIIRTYVAADACGNEATAIQIITLTDVTAPVVVEEPMDITVQCSDETWNYAEVSFTDNCDDEISVNFSVVYVPNGCLGSYVATWVATDNCGNSTTVDQVVEVIDTINPEFEYVPASYTIECSEEVVLENAYAFDDCSTAEVTVATETIAGDCPNTYTLVRTFTATDNCGNTAVAEQTISVVDTTAPVWNYDNMVYELSFECDETVAPVTPTAWDNCNEVEVLMNETIYYETPCYASGAFIFTAVDACGNESAPFYQYYSVSDNTAPVFNAYDAEITLPCDDYSGIYVSATDNCNSVEISYTDEHVSGGCQGRIIRSYTAADLCGNMSYAQQIITLSDETAPVIEAQSENMTIECGNEYATPWVEFADNCDEELEIISSVSSEGSCPEVITYTWTATDNCNNSTTATVVITIVDTTAPVFTFAPESFEVSCTEEFALEMATASDICDEMVDVTLVEEQIAGNCEGSYTIERTFTATDDCGNTAVHVQVINVVDNVAPEFTFVPEGGIVACAEYNGIAMATAVDACSSVEVSFIDVIEEQYFLGEEELCGTLITRNWTAVDACGNTATAVTTVFVYDNVAPVFDATVANVEVSCESEIPAYAELTATDACSEATVERSVEVVSADDCGNQVIVVSYVATDACGNTANYSYTITVNDEVAPVLSAMPADLVLDCEATVPAADAITAFDNCNGEIEVSFIETYVGDQPAVGSIADCNLITPALPAGNPCNYATPWAMALFNMPAASRFYTVLEGDFVRYPNGSIHVTASLVNAYNANAGFNVSVWFTGEMDWSQWSSQAFPTSFKADCGGIGANHQDWLYYILQNGEGAELVGWGEYAGSALNFEPRSSKQLLRIPIWKRCKQLQRCR
ncbi:MAG: hypothetical protein R2809_13705 [Flavobacteriales bacterium]